MNKPELNTIFENLDLDEVPKIADLGATSPKLAAQFMKRFESELVVIPVNGKGEFDEKSEEHAKSYLDILKKQDVDLTKVKFWSRSSKGRDKFDVILCVNGFGNGRNPSSAEKWLKKHLGPSSRVLMDIKKGSGGYGVLKKFGNVNTIAKYTDDDQIIARAILSVEPEDDVSNASIWKNQALDVIGPNGFFKDGQTHSFTFIPRSDVLVVTFDNLDIAMENRGDRKPWGYSFIEKQGWSMLGVMAHGWTWYRDDWVIEQFRALRAEGFFNQFSKTIFYGASMGGYAALAFSPACPGSTVLSFSPQSTLDKTIVPWETRYKKAWHRDYNGEFGDAAQTVGSAQDVYLFYDPYAPLDNAHANRIKGSNIHHYRAPLMGHIVGTNFQRMGILQTLVCDAVDGSLTKTKYHKLLQERKKLRRYLIALYNHAIDKNHQKLALRAAEYSEKSLGGDGFFQRAIAELTDLKKPT